MSSDAAAVPPDDAAFLGFRALSSTPPAKETVPMLSGSRSPAPTTTIPVTSQPAHRTIPTHSTTLPGSSVGSAKQESSALLSHVRQ